MTLSDAPAVRRQSIRVALAATVVVGLVYLAVAAAVVAITTRDLTAQIDRRLDESFYRLPRLDEEPPEGPVEPERDPSRPFGAPVLMWVIGPDGTVLASSTSSALPADLLGVTDPVTATIDDTQVRLTGRDAGAGRVVLAQAMDAVSDAQQTIVFGVLVIAPFLLVGVFLGAVVIGRRVAAPIEAARRRQLEFTADASHELRTPLSVIEANVSLALTQERDAAWYRTTFGRVDRESKRMRRVLEDMLWLARFDAAAAPPSAEPVDLGVLARQAADRFSVVAETRRLRLGVHVPAEAEVINASPELVDRLVGVLVDNACKYASEDGSVDVTVAAAGARVGLTVDDSGPGIPEEDRERIFDRFHRSTATAGEAQGAGLGLAIADAIVRATGGRWTVGVSPAGGARFSVSWSRVTLG